MSLVKIEIINAPVNKRIKIKLPENYAPIPMHLRHYFS